MTFLCFFTLILDDHTILHTYRSEPTNEELNLINYNIGEIPQNVIPVYFVQEFVGFATGEAFPPHANNGFVAVILNNRANEVVLAHELGHILTDIVEHQGYENDQTNLMYPFPDTNSRYLTRGQIETMRGSRYAK
jgi:hypothetical protein